MVARTYNSAECRPVSWPREGLEFTVFHAEHDVPVHIAALKCHRPGQVDCCSGDWEGLSGPSTDYATVPQEVALVPSVDLATRLNRVQPMLRSYLTHVDTLRDMYRSVNSSLDPVQIMAELAFRVGAWLPLANTAVVSTCLEGDSILLADSSLEPRIERATRIVGAWVMNHSREYSSASLRDDPLTCGGPNVAAIAFPLISRGRTVAAFVGIDHQTSHAGPRLSTSTLEVIQSWLEPAAVALDNAFRIRRAEDLSMTDDLTQLYNARYLKYALRRELERDFKTHQPVSLLFVDLDGFKRVNDHNGHLCGNRVLVEVSRILQECSRATDAVVRYGGDEFVIILPNTAAAGALLMATRIRQKIGGHVFLAGETVVHNLTASVGLVTRSDTISTTEEFVQMAIEAMYRDKVKKENKLQVISTTLTEGVTT